MTLLWALCALLVDAKPRCPQVECSEYISRAQWTGRVAIIVSGFIRTATATGRDLENIRLLNSPGTRVEIYYHVWYNATAPCDVEALESLSRFADGISVEPIECAWSWGKTGFQGHWHGVFNAFRALTVVFGLNPQKYGLVMRTGTDVSYGGPLLDVFNFSKLWDAYSGFGYDNFILVGYANGFDRHAIGTPSLMRAYSLYGPDDGFGCDSAMDSFPFQRMRRYGVTTVPGWTDLPHGVKPAEDPPRCGAFFISKHGIFRGSLLRPTDRLGCREHAKGRRLLWSPRRLAIRPPKGILRGPHAYCSKHQLDRFNATTASLTSMSGPWHHRNPPTVRTRNGGGETRQYHN